MKKFAMICLFASMAFGFANAQETEKKEVPANGAKIRFTELEHNYGTIMKGGDGKCTFTFVNEGNEPLILSNVKASCGCTTPSYTQKPVMPGQQGSIDVKYNTNNVGGFSKTVTVTSNAVDNPRVVLRIKGNVKQDANPMSEKQPAIEGNKIKNKELTPEIKSSSEKTITVEPAKEKAKDAEKVKDAK